MFFLRWAFIYSKSYIPFGWGMEKWEDRIDFIFLSRSLVGRLESGGIKKLVCLRR